MGRPSYGGQGGGDRRPRRDYRQSYNRRKVCQFCVDKVSYIDYKDVNRLRRYLSDRARIEPRRSSGACAKHQRRLSTAIKRARALALLPYTPEQLKTLGFTRPEGFRRGGEGYRGRYQRSEGGGYGGYRGGPSRGRPPVGGEGSISRSEQPSRGPQSPAGRTGDQPGPAEAQPVRAEESGTPEKRNPAEAAVENV